jgi:hypothetical protein
MNNNVSRPLHGVLQIREVFGTLNVLTIKLLSPYPTIKNKIPGSFVSVDVSRRTRRSTFLHQINELVEWACLEKELYKVRKRSIQDAAGRPYYVPEVFGVGYNAKPAGVSR